MLAGVLERLLKRYLSRWLSVTESHLHVLEAGVWSGELRLEQLHMLAAVLDQLRLPIGIGVRFKKGMVGSLHIQCNWARLTTQPVVLTLSDVYLLGELDPTRRGDTDGCYSEEELERLVNPDMIKAYLQSQKESLIAAAEATWEQFRYGETSGQQASNQSYISALTASLVASILDNICINVERIHVCIATSPRVQPVLRVENSSTSATEAVSVSPDTVMLSSPQSNSSIAAASASAAAAAASSAATAAAAAAPVPPLVSPQSTSSVASSSPSPDPSSSSFPVGWSLGVLLSSLSLQTTDADGQPTFVKSAGGVVHKQARIDGMSVYLATNATPLPDAASGSDEYFMRIMAKPFTYTHDESIDREWEEDEQESRADTQRSSTTVGDATSDAELTSSSDSSSDDDDDTFEDGIAYEDAREAPPLSRLDSSSLSSSSPLTRQLSSSTPRKYIRSVSSKGAEVVHGLEYLLRPFDAIVRLRLAQSRATSAGQSSTISAGAASTSSDARIGVSMVVERLQLEFSSKQLEILQALAAVISSSEHALRHAPHVAPRRRPGWSKAVTQAWWRYAIEVTRRECRERIQQWDKSWIFSFRRAFHEYAPLYAAMVQGRISASQTASMQQLEEGWDAHHIIMWRSLVQKSLRIKEAMKHVTKHRGKSKKRGKDKNGGQHQDEKAASGSIIGWLGSWLRPSSTSSSGPADESISLSEEERAQLWEMLGYDPFASVDQLAAVEQAIKLDFTLGNASITLYQTHIYPPKLRSKKTTGYTPADDYSNHPAFPLCPRTRTTRRAFIHASMHDFLLRVSQSMAGVSVELSLYHLLVEDRMANCDRFDTLIMPRSYRAAKRKAGVTRPSFTPLVQTPMRDAQAQSHASPLHLPESASAQQEDDDRPSTVTFAPPSPDVAEFNVPEPPLMHMRLSYHLPSMTLAAPAPASQAHVELWLVVQPLDIVYSAGAVANLQAFARTATPSSPDLDGSVQVLWQELEVAALNAFRDLQRRSAAKLDYIMNHHVRIDLDVNIQAPTILVYHHDPSDHHSCLAIHLGHVTCVTQEKQTTIAVEPEDDADNQPSADLTASHTFNMGGAMEAAVARERALSGSTTNAAATGDTSAKQRQELFYDQFHLVIKDANVQLVPLRPAAPRADSLPTSTNFSPIAAYGMNGMHMPALHLPAAAFDTPSASGATSSSHRPSHRVWLARRRALSARSKRAESCGPVIDAFTPTLHVMSSVLPSDTSIPRMKVQAMLPPIKLHLSSAKMKRILDIVSSFPSASTPPSTSPNFTAAPPPPGSINRDSSFATPSTPTPSRSQFGSPDVRSSNRRTSSSFHQSRETAMATAAQVVEARSATKESNSTTAPPADWVMMHFQLKATQLAIQLSSDCDIAAEQAAEFGASTNGVSTNGEVSIDVAYFLLEGLELSVTQFPSSLDVEAQLHGLFLEDCMNRERPSYRYLLSSSSAPTPIQSSIDETEFGGGMAPSSLSAPPPAAAKSSLTDLIYLRYHQTKDSSPTAVAASVDSLQVDFNTLQINFNRATFKRLIDFMQPLLDALEKQSQADQHTHTRSPSISESPFNMSRSVDFAAMQPTRSSSQPTNMSMSASFSHLPSSMSSPHTPSRFTPSYDASVVSPPVPGFSTPSSRSIPPSPATLPSVTRLSQAHLLQRVTDKITNGGDSGLRRPRSRFRPSASQLHLQARINLITISLNQETDNQLSTIARTEIQGIHASVKHQDCPCGGCTQLQATLANLTLYEILSTAADNLSSYSRRSEVGSLHHPTRLPHSHSSHSLRDGFSPMPHNDIAASRLGATRARRIFWKRQASDTALITLNCTDHALSIHPTSPSSASSSSCLIRARTLREQDDPPLVDPSTLAYDQVVSLHLTSMQTAIVPEFFLRVQTFFEEAARESGMLKEASDRAAEKAKAAYAEMKQMAEANCSLLQFSINIDNPLILLPHSPAVPANRPLNERLTPPSASPMSGRSSPRVHDVGMMMTDYMIIDLGKIKLSNSFEMSEDKHVLLPPPPPPPSPSALPFHPRHSRSRSRRRSMVMSGRMPLEKIQVSLSAMNLSLITQAGMSADAATGTGADSMLPSDELGPAWQRTNRRKVFEDVHAQLNVSLIVLSPHLSFIDVPNAHVSGTISTIHAHISEQLITFLLGLYSVELAPLVAMMEDAERQRKERQEAEDMDMQVEEDRQFTFPRSQTSLPTVSLPVHSRVPSNTSTVIYESKDEEDDLMDEMRIIDEGWESEEGEEVKMDEENDDEADGDAAHPPDSRTHESISTAVDVLFEGLVVDVMLTPPLTVQQTLHEEDKLEGEGQSWNDQYDHTAAASFLSPAQASAFSPSFLSPTDAGGSSLAAFSFAPVAPTSDSWLPASHSPRQPSPCVQLRVNSMKVAYKVTSILQLASNGSRVQSEHTSVELSLGSLALEDVRAECPHALLRQVIGGHKDTMKAEQVLAPPETSPAYDDDLTMRSRVTTPPSARTVLPDLKLKYECLDIERSAAGPAAASLPSSSSFAPFITPALDAVTVQTSVDLEFVAPRLVVSPSFLHAMTKLSDTYSALLDVTKQTAASPTPTQTNESTSQATLPLSGGTETRVTARIIDPQLWLMSEADGSSPLASAFTPAPLSGDSVPPRRASPSPSECDSDMRDIYDAQERFNIRPLSCVVLRGSLDVDATLSATISAHIAVTEVEALVCYRAYHLRLARLNPPPVPVLQPFNIDVKYDMTIDDGDDAAGATLAQHAAKAFSTAPVERSHRLIVDIGHLDSRVSFLQLSSAANIGLGLMAALPTGTDSPSATGVGQSKPLDSPVAFLSTFRGMVQIRTHDIHLTLVNDAPGYFVPLLSCSVKPLLLSVLDAKQSESLHTLQLAEQARPTPSQASGPTYLSASRFTPASRAPDRKGTILLVSCGIEAMYYNQQLADWELFLHPFRCDVRADATNIVISSRQLLNLYVNPSCITTMAQGMDCMQRQLFDTLHKPPVSTHLTATPKKPNNRAAAAPSRASYFRVRNETGLRLRFWPVEAMSKKQTQPGTDMQPSAPMSLYPRSMSDTCTVEPSDEHTVPLRQYIGIGGFEEESSLKPPIGVDESNGSSRPPSASARRWLYRSPMLALQLEAGLLSDDWSAWNTIQPVPLVATTTDAHVDVVSGAETDAAHAQSDLTLHTLAPSEVSSTGEADVEQRHALPSTVVACRLVSQTDADGSVAQVLVVSSAILLVNRMRFAMCICLVDTSAERVLFECILQSGQSMSLPVLMQAWTRVKLIVRPHGSVLGNEWRWSNAGLRLSLLQSKAAHHTLLKCKSHKENEAMSGALTEKEYDDTEEVDVSFCCSLNISATTMTSSTASRPTTGETASDSLMSKPATATPIAPTLYTIALDPPLSFKNLLGCSVCYQVSVYERTAGQTLSHTRLADMQRTERRSGFLPHNYEVHFYTIDLGTAAAAVVTMQLRRIRTTMEVDNALMQPQSPRSAHVLSSDLAGSGLASIESGEWNDEWSAEAVIHSTSGAAECSPALVLHDKDGVGLRVQLDYSGSGSCSIDTHHLSSGTMYPYARAGQGLVTAYVPYWISNQSGLPLLYGTIDVDDQVTIEQCAGQSETAVTHAAQALVDLEGVDELSMATAIDSITAPVTSSSWFHFRDARQTFGSECRSGIESLFGDDEDDHEGDTGLDIAAGDWRWHPALMHRPLDEAVFLISPADADDKFNAQLMFVSGTEDEPRRAVLRLPNTDWSSPFNMDTVGWEGMVQLTERVEMHRRRIERAGFSVYDQPRPDRPERIYPLAVRICLHDNPIYHHTKIVQLTPRYFISNHTIMPLHYRQVGSSDVRTIPPHQQQPIHWLEAGRIHAISMRFSSFGWQWAAKRHGVSLDRVGLCSVRMRNVQTQKEAVLHFWSRLIGTATQIIITATLDQSSKEEKGEMVMRSKLLQSHDGLSTSLLAGPPSVGRGLTSSMLNASMYASATDLNASMTHSQYGGDTPSLLPPNRTIAPDDRHIQHKLHSDPTQTADLIPYRIENHSRRVLVFHQADEPQLKQRLLRTRSCPYAWDEPFGRKEIVLYCLTGDGSHMEDEGVGEEQRVGSYSLDKIASYPPVWLPPNHHRQHGEEDDANMKVEEQVCAHVFADGRVRVLRLIEYAQALSVGLHPTQAHLNSRVSASSIDGSAGKVDESAFAPTWNVELRLAGVGVSIITHVHSSAQYSGSPFPDTSTSMRSSHPLALLGLPYTRQELLHLSIHSIRAHMVESNANQTIKLAIGHVQLDNQLHSAAYPVVIRSVSKPIDKKRGWFSSRPTLPPGVDPALDVNDEFFNIAPSYVAQENDERARRAKSTLPSWLSVALVISHQHSKPNFIFMPGLAVRMQTLKVNVEESLIHHIDAFAQMLAPAINILTKPTSTMAARRRHQHGDDWPRLHSSSLPYSPDRSSSMSFSSDDGSLSPTSFSDNLSDTSVDASRQRSSAQSKQDGVRCVPIGAVVPISQLDHHRHGQHHEKHVQDRSVENRRNHMVGRMRKTKLTRYSSEDKFEQRLTLYFQHLIIHTIDIQVTLSMSGEEEKPVTSSGAPSSTSHPLFLLLSAVGATLLNFKDAPLKLGSLHLSDVFASGDEVASLVSLHYRNQLTSLVYNVLGVLGSSDILGNPVAFFGAITTGVGELLSKPAHGLAHSPSEFVTSAAGAVVSLAQWILFACSNAAGSMAKSISKGFSRLARTSTPSQQQRRGLLQASVRSVMGLAADAARTLSALMDGLRNLVNPTPRLLRTREPIFFEAGWKPRILQVRLARCIGEYLRQYSNETFVAAVEQYVPEEGQSDAALAGAAARPSLPSSASASISSVLSTSFASSSQTSIRAPVGSSLVLLITTHAVVIFCIWHRPSRRDSQLLHRFTLDHITNMQAETQRTLITVVTMQNGESTSHARRHAVMRMGGTLARQPRFAHHTPILTPIPPSFPSTPCIFQTLLPFLFKTPAHAQRQTISLPFRLPNQLAIQTLTLIHAARHEETHAYAAINVNSM